MFKTLSCRRMAESENHPGVLDNWLASMYSESIRKEPIATALASTGSLEVEFIPPPSSNELELRIAMLQRKIFIIISLLLGMPAPVQAGVDGILGYARMSKLYTGGRTGVRFDVLSPFYRVEGLRINMTFRVKTSNGAIPKNVACNLWRGFKHVPADSHAVPGESGELGLVFEQLDASTNLQFVIAWKNKPGQKVYPHSATIQATENGLGWKRSAKNIFGSFSREDDGTPVQIVIDGPNNCRLL
ncbi:MAG: hypothetical protein KZQ85_08780 [Candidatus Thiodiazotropha sp. (ex Myrtea sp. 'scaly one' KF741663)]|nr:hypothetical protein [Candidatus Thiodiazotropha sp. (ex Myrtea sp. 'scaly one' KF741663)]